jgi:DNA-binding NarL/FixJ family response regulator
VAISLFILLRERTFADALAIRLGKEPDMDVVAALHAASLSPRVSVGSEVDVVLLDADIAGNAALRLCQELSRSSAPPHVILLSYSTSPERIVRAISTGAAGWVGKDESLERLIQVIRGVARGETWLPPAQTGLVLRLLLKGYDRACEPEVPVLSMLTDREREVLICLAEGTPRRDVAKRLHMSPNTVRTHLQKLMGKLDVHSAMEAVALTRAQLDDGLTARPWAEPEQRSNSYAAGIVP